MKNSGKWDYILLLLYKFIVDLTYLYFVSPVYSYAGSTVTYSITKYIYSWIIFIVLLPYVVFCYRSKKPSSLLLLLVYLIYFIPSLTLYAFWMKNDMFMVFLVLYWILLIIFNKVLFRKSVLRDISGLFYGKIADFFILFIVISMLFVSGVYNNFNLHISLLDVYDLRSEQKEMDLPLLVGYLQPLSSSIVPIAIVYYMILKKKTYVVFLVFIQILNFAFGGARTTIFAILIAFGAYYFYSDESKKKIVWGLIFFSLAAFIEYMLSGFEMSYVGAYVFRRSIFMPIELSHNYFDFFQTHELLYLRDSFLRWFGMSSPYNGLLPKEIGDYYYNLPLMSCNNGLCGDAYGNFGWSSLFVYPFLLSLAFKMMDLCANNIDNRLTVIVCILFAIPITNMSFFGLLLTNGYIVTCWFLLTLPRGKER